MTNRIAIEQGLLRRVEKTRSWVEEHKGENVLGLTVRNHPAQLKILQFLADKRVEANGVRFRLFFGNETKKFFTDLDVRINPKWVMAEGKDDTAPYIVVYALSENGAGDSLNWFYFNELSLIADELDTGDWYLSFIKKAIRPGSDGKVMIHRQEVGTDV